MEFYQYSVILIPKQPKRQYPSKIVGHEVLWILDEYRQHSIDKFSAYFAK